MATLKWTAPGLERNLPSTALGLYLLMLCVVLVKIILLLTVVVLLIPIILVTLSGH